MRRWSAPSTASARRPISRSPPPAALPGELCQNWRAKSVGTFDCEFGFSCMGYEIAGAWGAKMADPGARCRRHDGRRLIPDDELRHLFDGAHRPQAHRRGLRQWRLRRHRPAAERQGLEVVQQLHRRLAHRESGHRRFREARRLDGRSCRDGPFDRRARAGLRPRQEGRPHLRHRHQRSSRINGPRAMPGGRSAFPRSARARKSARRAPISRRARRSSGWGSRKRMGSSE